jgi:hypothetical protein
MLNSARGINTLASVRKEPQTPVDNLIAQPYSFLRECEVITLNKGSQYGYVKTKLPSGQIPGFKAAKTTTSLIHLSLIRI